MFTALGFYPVAPGRNQYIIGRPFLPHRTLDLPDGKRFVVIAGRLEAGHGYSGRASLNGKPLDHASLPTHAEILAGGKLRLTMQAEPAQHWATAPARRPHSISQ